jgi:RNA polymerase sigma-70 factor (ECF subfamily)
VATGIATRDAHELGATIRRGSVDDLSTVPNEPTLAERFSSDPDALQECYRTMGPMVLAFIRRLIGATDAEDVLQQVFLEVWRSRERFDPTQRLEAWLLDIARKRSIDHLRRQSRRREDVESVVDAAEAIDVVQFADRYVDAATVRQALAELSDVERESLVLAYFGQLSHREIANRLDVPLGTVKARVFRGLRSLSGLLAAEEGR